MLAPDAVRVAAAVMTEEAAVGVAVEAAELAVVLLQVELDFEAGPGRLSRTQRQGSC